VLLENDGGEERGLEAVGRPVADDPSKAPQRRARGRRLQIVRQAVEETLDSERRPKPCDQPALAR
jgi:hypothetical protein